MWAIHRKFPLAVAHFGAKTYAQRNPSSNDTASIAPRFHFICCEIFIQLV